LMSEANIAQISKPVKKREIENTRQMLRQPEAAGRQRSQAVIAAARITKAATASIVIVV